jgi:hypothetical protein
MASARFASSAIAPAIFHAGGAAADYDEVEQPPLLDWVRLGLGLLEREQDSSAQVGRVVDGL